eukprot:CAMPEP_0198116206 /NCGR_PEP_ID=MMETSP1442-20131203/10605_1 /TAXON_ID= /ORGANISM="Craspedostauros australis, Strain CCMP3328" /LENGTH=237 /DNA_ID=CAMNT_0043773963 /DNA_START=55 /DNA_END=768 /DNA_ORIENTATION=-
MFRRSKAASNAAPSGVIVNFDKMVKSSKASSLLSRMQRGRNGANKLKAQRQHQPAVDPEVASTCSTESVSTMQSLVSSLSSSQPIIATTATTQHRNEKKGKKVTFDSQPKGLLIPMPSPEEIHERWYDMHNYDSFREDSARTIALIQKCQRDTLRQQSDDYCVRGLEGMSRAGALRCKKQQGFARQAVLKLQKECHSKGLPNSEAIAEAYEKASSKSVTIALSYARRDEEDVYRQQD